MPQPSLLTSAHDTERTAVGSLDLSDERERLEREQPTLSRKQHRSASYETQRRRVAECHADRMRKRCNFVHTLSNHYARGYDLVAVEDLHVTWMVESPSNSRHTASAAW
jgi:putative transposase